MKSFDEDLIEWIDFVCRCRDGVLDYLEEIKVYPSYDQMAFITQKTIDRLLTFEAYEEV